MTPIVGDLIQGATQIIGKFIPDADKKIEAQLELAKLADGAAAREEALLQGQIEVNKAEASSGNLFVAGWRPFIGWTCGGSLAYTWVLAPIAKFVFHLATVPAVPTETIYPILMAMLGIAGMRTYEKVQGVAAQDLTGQPAPTPTPQSPADPKTGQDTQSSSNKNPKVGAWFK